MRQDWLDTPRRLCPEWAFAFGVWLMRRSILAVAIVLALAGCQTTPEPPMEQTSKYAPTEADQTAIADAFERILKDPDSARFPVIYARIGQSGMIYYCGLVNARNSYGGYTGNQPFYGLGKPGFASILTIGSDEVKSAVAVQMCQRAGFVNPGA